MAYEPTTWVNGSTPALNATNLNKIEAGVKTAQDDADAINDAILFAPAATGDAATDTAAVQAIIETARNSETSGNTGCHIYFPPGEYVLNDTIDLLRFNGSLRGQGNGNSPAHSTLPGRATVFRWAGANDRPMFQLLDTRSVGFEDLRLEGNNTNPPTYGIDSFSVEGDGQGTNSHLLVRRCHIGTYTWSSQGTNVGSMGGAIGFTGFNTNNDQFHIENTVLRGTGRGFYAPNSQSIWGQLTNVYCDSCTTAGIEVGASLSATNLTFNANAIDVKVTGSPRVIIDGWWSENSELIYDLAEGAAMSVHGGKWQVMSSMTGNSYINAANLVANDLTVRDVYIQYAITAIPLYARGGYAATPYRIAISGCKGLTEALMDVRGYGAAGKTFVDIHNGSVDASTTITNKALSTYIGPQTKGGTYSLLDGESTPVIVTAATTITLPDATAVRGSSRFTIKATHSSGCTVASGGGTIDGASTDTLAQWETHTYFSDGTNWFAL